MPAIAYEFRELGASRTAKGLLEVAAAQERLNKSQRTTGGRSPQARAGASNAEALAAKRSQREFEAAERAKSRVLERETRARWKETTKGLKAVEREEKQFFKRQAAEHKRSAAQAAREFERNQQRRRQAAARFKHERLSTIGTMLGGAGLAMGAAAIGLGAASFRQFEANDMRARALAISGNRRDDSRALLNEAVGTTQKVRGVTAEQVLTGQQKFTAMTGDLASARRFRETFALASSASGARNEDIAATAATFRQKFGITNEGEMQKAMASTIAMGKAGAFELSDASQYYSEMGAAASRFNIGQGSQAVARLGALSQFAMQSTGSGAEASTAVRAMFADLIQNSHKVKQMSGGKEMVFADKGHTKSRDIVDVLAGTIKSSKGDLKKLDQVFGERGIKAVSSLVTEFNRAANESGGTEKQRMDAGEKAVRAMFNEMKDVTGAWNDVVADAAVATDTASARMTQAWEKISNDVGATLEPSLKQLADAAMTCAPLFTSLAKEVGSSLEGMAALANFLGMRLPKEEKPPELSAGAQYQLDKHRIGKLEEAKKSGTITRDEIKELDRLKSDVKSYEEAAPTHMQATEPATTDKNGNLIRQGVDPRYHGKRLDPTMPQSMMTTEEKRYLGLTGEQALEIAGHAARSTGVGKGLERTADPTKVGYNPLKGGLASNQFGFLANLAKQAASAGDKQNQAADKMLQAADKNASGGNLFGSLFGN